MIFSIITRNWRLLMDIAIVLAIIFLVFLWNPFGWFGSGLKLQNTANMVSEIKEIGELVTAEYYGEVIASHEEAELEIVDIDSIELLGQEVYRDIKERIGNEYREELDRIETKHEDIRNERKQRRRIERDMRAAKKEIVKSLVNDIINNPLPNEDILHSTVLFTGSNEHSTRIKTRKFVRKKDNGRRGYVRRILQDVLTLEYDRIVKYFNGDIAFTNYLESGFQTHARYTDFFYNYIELSKPRRERKTELAVIGRGSVKAGFKFDQLDEGNFVYDETNRIIYFFGFNAEILNQDINPWFIPERKVPGFQIVAERNGTFEKMKELKIHCVEKLVHNAGKAGILEQAQQNGEEALKEFFTLLTGDDINQVIFRQGTLAFQSNEIVQDSVISPDEIELIETILDKAKEDIANETNEIIKTRRKELLRAFISELAQYDIQHTSGTETAKYPFNFYNRYIPQLLRDTIVTTDEIVHIATNIRHEFVGYDSEIPTYRGPEEDYWFWYDDSLEYVGDFNRFIQQINTTTLNKGFFKTYDLDELNCTLSNDAVLRDSQIQKINIISNTSSDVAYSINGNEVRFWGLMPINEPVELKYPVKSDINFTRSLIEADSTTAWENVEEIFTTSTIAENDSNPSLPQYVTFVQGFRDDSVFVQLDTGKYQLLNDNIVSGSVTIGIGNTFRNLLNRLPVGSDTVAYTIRSNNLLMARTRVNQPSTDHRIAFIKREDNQVYWKLLGIDPSAKRLEVIFSDIMQLEALEVSNEDDQRKALENYILESNRRYNDIGPVMKARRSVQEFIAGDGAISSAATRVKSGLNSWANHIKGSIR